MLKQIISASVVTVALLLNGCGDSAGENKLEAQHAIDSGDASKAIALLEPVPFADLNDTQKTAFLASLSDTDKMTLASAYVSKAGVSIMDIVSKLDTADGETSSFASIADDIIGDANATEVADKVESIDIAIEYYEAMGDSLISSAPSYMAMRAAGNSDITVDGAKLYLGMAYFSKVTMLLSFFGDVSTLEGSGETDAQFKATEDAIKCIYTGLSNSAHADCSGITIQDVTLYVGSGKRLTINIDGTNYDRFATGQGESFLVANYTRWSDLYASNTNAFIVNNFPFGTDYKFENEVLEALNGAYDLILETAPDDVKTDMQENFADIDNNPADSEITMDELRAYMAKE